MPMHCTEAATRSCNRNSGIPPFRTCADKPGKPDRRSGPVRAPPSKPSQSSKSPKPECASEPPLRYIRAESPTKTGCHTLSKAPCAGRQIIPDIGAAVNASAGTGNSAARRASKPEEKRAGPAELRAGGLSAAAKYGEASILLAENA